MRHQQKNAAKTSEGMLTMNRVKFVGTALWIPLGDVHHPVLPWFAGRYNTLRAYYISWKLVCFLGSFLLQLSETFE